MGFLPLIAGQCRQLLPPQTSRRRQRVLPPPDSSHASTPVPLDTAQIGPLSPLPNSAPYWLVLHAGGPSSSNTAGPIVLCRGTPSATSSFFSAGLRGKGAAFHYDDNEDDERAPTLLCYSDSVQIIPFNYNTNPNSPPECKRLWHTLSPFLEIRHSYVLQPCPAKIQELHHASNSDDDSPSHMMMMLVPTKNSKFPDTTCLVAKTKMTTTTTGCIAETDDDSLPSLVASLSHAPSLLLSVSLSAVSAPSIPGQETATLEDPLLMACLKRQLAGITIAYSQSQALTSLVSISLPSFHPSDSSPSSSSSSSGSCWVFQVTNVLARQRNVQVGTIQQARCSFSFQHASRWNWRSSLDKHISLVQCVSFCAFVFLRPSVVAILRYITDHKDNLVDDEQQSNQRGEHNDSSSTSSLKDKKGHFHTVDSTGYYSNG
jgi:hypothetical protein